MTTIAIRDGFVAADTGLTRGGSQVATTTKIIRNVAGDVAGAVGDAGWAAKFLNWFVAGEVGGYPKIERIRDDTIGRGFIARVNGELTIFEEFGAFNVRAPYYVLGSGGGEALGAMFMGASAEQAVRAAIVLDEGTFGDVNVLRIGT